MTALEVVNLPLTTKSLALIAGKGTALLHLVEIYHARGGALGYSQNLKMDMEKYSKMQPFREGFFFYANLKMQANNCGGKS